MENPPKKFFRLGVGLQVRLKNAYIIKCTGFKKDENGTITQVEAEYFPDSRSGSDKSGIVVKGTIHWVSVLHALSAEVRLYDRLFKVENPGNEEGDFKSYINPGSLQVLNNVYIEPALREATFNHGYQFIRKGYFVLDEDSSEEKIVFNRTVTLKDTWAKEVKKA
jgi:glutaminyl-tRNA synthetase